jgi:hypothetical protein
MRISAPTTTGAHPRTVTGEEARRKEARWREARWEEAR